MSSDSDSSSWCRRAPDGRPARCRRRRRRADLRRPQTRPAQFGRLFPGPHRRHARRLQRHDQGHHGTHRPGSPAGEGFLASVCCQWEEAAFRASPKTKVVAARMALVLAKEALAMKRMLLPFKFFVGGPLGSGRQWFPWIHIDDVVSMYQWVVENDSIQGPVNFSAPQQVTMKEFAKAMGKVLHRPSIFKVPEFMLRLAVGESADMIVNSKRVVPKVVLENGFQFKKSELDEALIYL